MLPRPAQLGRLNAGEAGSAANARARTFRRHPFAPSLAWGMRVRMDDVTIADADARSVLVQLLGEVAAKRPAALREFYELTASKLYGICLRLLGDESEAQDVLQDVYVTIWRKAEFFDPAKAGAITWTATLARNKAIDRLRSRRAPTRPLDEALGIADDSASSLAVLEQAEDARRLRACLDTLDERARAMIRAAFFDGATYVQLADREGVPVPTIKSWIRRGLQRLRGCLES